MIKRIIFDIDNTLLDWQEKNWISLNIALDKLNYEYDSDLILKIRRAIKNYEKDCIIYNKEDMLREINSNLDKKLPACFMDLWLDALGECVDPIDSDVIETIAYLSNKYELVTFSNWFAYSQSKRLDKAKLLKYFKYNYGADSIPRKPYKEGYLKSLGGNKPEECIIIGDNIDWDVKDPMEIGMKAIHYNRNDEKPENGYQTIYHLKELMKIL